MSNLVDQRCGPTGRRILQIHPTRRCNLSCVHCYSNSGPSVREELSLGLVTSVIADAARLGYSSLSVSGGEPFLFRGLRDALTVAHDCGMQTSVTSNGHFLGRKQLDPVREHLDAIAISLDGPPDIHNALRGSPNAFDRLVRGLDNLRASGIPFGFIHTLTAASWRHLVWLADFAIANGARLLQLHGLETVGRADRSGGLAMDEDMRSRSYILAAILANKHAGLLDIQIDLLHRDQIVAQPGLVYARASDDAPPPAPGVLVLETDGTVVPITYGMSRQYQVCNIHHQSLASAWPNFLTTTVPRLNTLCQSLFDRLTADDMEPLFNWHEHLCADSLSPV